jgi:hypothetical protein
VKTKIAQGCSERFIKDAKRIITLWKRYESEQHLKYLTLDKLQPSHIRNFLVRPNWSAKTQRTVKSTLSPLLAEFKPHLVQSIKLKKPTSTLNKPYTSLSLLQKKRVTISDYSLVAGTGLEPVTFGL